MRDNPVLRVVAKIVVPAIFLFALYVQFHGDYGPGGGFQAGIIFAAGLILYGLIFGTESIRGLISTRGLRVLIAVGLLAGSGLGFQNALGDTAREKTLVIAVPGTPASID